MDDIGDIGSWEVGRRRANETNQPYVSTETCSAVVGSV